MPIIGALLLLDLPSLVALAFAVVALVYLILVWAGGTLFGAPFRFLMQKIPFVGSQVADAVGGVLDQIGSYAVGWVDGAIYPLVRILSTIPQLIVAGVNTFIGSVEWLVGQVVAITGQLVSLSLGLAFQLAVLSLRIAENSGLIALLQTGVHAVSAQLTWAIDTFVPAQIRDAIATMAAYAAGLVATAEAALRAEIAVVAGDVARVETALAADVTAIDNELVNQVWPAIDNLAGELNQLLPLALPVTFPLLLTRVAALEATLTTAMDECVNPVCNALLPSLNALKALENGAALVALAALIGEAAHDPDGTAKTMAAEVNGIVGAAMAILSPVTGLRL